MVMFSSLYCSVLDCFCTGMIIRQIIISNASTILNMKRIKNSLHVTMSCIFSQTLKVRLVRCLATSISTPETSCGSGGVDWGLEEHSGVRAAVGLGSQPQTRERDRRQVTYLFTVSL